MGLQEGDHSEVDGGDPTALSGVLPTPASPLLQCTSPKIETALFSIIVICQLHYHHSPLLAIITITASSHIQNDVYF